MRLDTHLTTDLGSVVDAARRLEAVGFDGVFTTEAQLDVFAPHVLVAEHTLLTSYTNVAIAFPRSPMHLATTAWALQKYSGGRFLLGLGSQIKVHVEKRYSATWGEPVPHLRELVAATRAVFDRFQHGTPLDHRGEYYTLTLMTPAFDPGPLPSGPPPILLGGLGPHMTRLAGEVADGLLVHPFQTERFLRERSLPLVAEGLAASGRDRSAFTYATAVMVGAARDEVELDAALAGLRSMIAFYASTPAYRPVLDLHGWGDLQPELNRLTKEGRWDEIPALVDDELVHAIGVVGTPDDVARELVDRYGDYSDRLAFYAPYRADDATLAEVLDRIRHLTVTTQEGT